MKWTGQDVIRIYRLLEDGGVPTWLDGGWGIDALLKRESRAHRDMDLIVPLDYLAHAESMLGEAGFAKDDRETNLPTRLVLRNCDGLDIDIHPVTFQPDGSAVHIDLDAGGGPRYPYVHSAAGLSGVGKIDGRVVHCTTAAEQIRQKVERRYSPWSESRIRKHGVSADLEDLRSLLQIFGCAEGGSSVPAMALEARPAGNLVVDAAEKFCLRHVTALSKQHSRLTAQHAELNVQHSRIIAQNAELNVQHSRIIAQNAELITQFNDIRASTSWQLTAPMRWAVNWLGMHRLKLRTQ